MERNPPMITRSFDASVGSFEAFWPHYLAAHALPSSRWLHFAGTSLAICLILGSVVLQRWGLLVAALAAGYGLAWLGHGLERNRPVSLAHPLWSLRADLRMWALMLSGKLDGEIRRLSPVLPTVDEHAP